MLDTGFELSLLRISFQLQNRISLLKREYNITFLSLAFCLPLCTIDSSLLHWYQVAFLDSFVHWKVTSSDLQICQRQKTLRLSLFSFHAGVLTKRRGMQFFSALLHTAALKLLLGSCLAIVGRNHFKVECLRWGECVARNVVTG